MGRYKEFLQGRCACHFHEVTQLYLSANEVLPMVRAAGLTADVLLCFLRWRSFGPQNFPVTERPPWTRPEQRELYIHLAANQPCQTRSRRRGLNPQPIVLEDQWTKYTLRSFWAACVPLPETEHLGGARWILRESHLSPSRTWTSERGGGLVEVDYSEWTEASLCSSGAPIRRDAEGLRHNCWLLISRGYLR